MAVAVDVCVATFRRPQLLVRLLTSLFEQVLDGIDMHVIVIDNDAAASARAVLSAFSHHVDEGGRPRLLYDVEPQQSIALVRNRAMQHVRADYFAFVDDDQTVSRHWLCALFECLERYGCDVVFGPVVSELPPNAPAWASRCFARPQHRTGEAVPHGGAGNVMIRRSAMGAARFNPAFGLTGGEDTDFFYRLHQAGHRLIWCEEASANEAVPPARLTLAWIRRRGFRDGQTYARIFVQPNHGLKKVTWFTRKCLQLAGGLLIAPVVRCVSYANYVALTVRLAAASGQLAIVFSGWYLEEYRVPGPR